MVKKKHNAKTKASKSPSKSLKSKHHSDNGTKNLPGTGSGSKKAERRLVGESLLKTLSPYKKIKQKNENTLPIRLWLQDSTLQGKIK